MPTLVSDKPTKRKRRAVARDRRAAAAAAARIWIRDARTAIIMGGVPECVVDRAERAGPVDWRSLAGELDGLSMAVGGRLGIRLFWETPNPHLAGKTPLQALEARNGIGCLPDVVRLYRTDIERSKIG